MTAARAAAAVAFGPALALALALAWPGAAAADEAADQARARAWFTDTLLQDQSGKEVRFYTDVLEDRTVAIGFIFTRCQGACPLIMEKLQRTRALLGEAFGKEVQFVVISVDPAFDTPAELRRFAERHGARGPGWTLLTGQTGEVRRVLQRLGAAVDDPEEHSTVLYAGNTRSRHWTRLRPDAGPPVVADALRHLAAETPAAPPAR